MGPAAGEAPGVHLLRPAQRTPAKHPFLTQASITSPAPGGKCGCGCSARSCVPEVTVAACDRSRWLSWLGKAVLCTCGDISKAAPENKGVKGEQTSCFEPPGVVHPLERKTEHENTSKRPLQQPERSWCGAAVGTQVSPGVRVPESVPAPQPLRESHSVLENKAQGSSTRPPLHHVGCARLCSSSPTP